MQVMKTTNLTELNPKALCFLTTLQNIPHFRIEYLLSLVAQI